jgi:pilus assembly protein Flp/PilA
MELNTRDGLQLEHEQLPDEQGATAVEYGLMVALIAVAILGAVTLVGTNIETMYSTIAALV